MRIMLEGCDGTGKTTLARLLADKYKLDFCHCTQNDPTDCEFYIQTARKNNIIWDRHTIGELIYPEVFNRPKTLTIEEAWSIIRVAKRYGTKIFILTADIDDIRKRLIDRGTEDPRVLNKLEWIDERFRYYAMSFDLPLIDTTKMTLEDIFELVEKEEPPSKFIH